MIDDKQIIRNLPRLVNRNFANCFRVRFTSDSVPILLRCTNMKDNDKTPVNKGSRKNRKINDASDSQLPILEKESEAFIARLNDVVGDEPVLSFSRRCGVSEGTIRNVLLNGAWPRTDNLVSFANAGGVLVDWLATGRLPKTRAELNALGRQAAEGRAAYDLPPLDRARLHLALVMADDAVRLITEPITPERRADLVLTFYDRLGASNDKP